MCLDLVRQKENTPRESKVGSLFSEAVKELNTQLPVELRIRYKPMDFKAMQTQLRKSSTTSVYDALFSTADESLQMHGFFAFSPKQTLPNAGVRRGGEGNNDRNTMKERGEGGHRTQGNSGRSGGGSGSGSAQHINDGVMKYHFGTIATTKSEMLLQGRRVGTFLIREDPGDDNVHVLSYVTSSHQIRHVVLFKHPRTGMYRLPNTGHWVKTLGEAVINYGDSHHNELRAGLKYEGHLGFSQEETLTSQKLGNTI